MCLKELSNIYGINITFQFKNEEKLVHLEEKRLRSSNSKKCWLAYIVHNYWFTL